MFKSENKIDYTKYVNKIGKSKLVISHTRFSTSGFEVKYNHPFSNENFVLVHNGVINQFLNGSGSDTHGFFNEFNKEFKKLKEIGSRQDRIVQTIKNLFEEDGGTYSILIFDKKTRQSYYFRNIPSINFYKNDEFLFITTESDNQKFLSLISNKEFVQLDIQSGKIYHINEKGEVFKVGELPERTYSSLDYGDEELGYEDEEEQKKLFKEEKEVFERKRKDEDGEYSLDDINKEIEEGWEEGR